MLHTPCPDCDVKHHICQQENHAVLPAVRADTGEEITVTIPAGALYVRVGKNIYMPLLNKDPDQIPEDHDETLRELWLRHNLPITDFYDPGSNN